MSPPTLPEALAKLAAQGGPDDIALHLRAGGFTGKQCAAWDCPLTNYLTATLDGAWVAGPNEVYPDGEDLDASQVHLLPPDVSTFVRQFDAGRYPDLECDDA